MEALLTFRSSFWKTFRPFAIAIGALTILGVLAAGLGAKAMVGEILLIGFGGLLFFALLILLACRIFAVRVSPEGIFGYDFMGRYALYRWESMRSVSVHQGFAWLGLRYAVVVSDGLPALWVPLFLDNPDGFRDAVGRWAPENNPLREILTG